MLGTASEEGMSGEGQAEGRGMLDWVLEEQETYESHLWEGVPLTGKEGEGESETIGSLGMFAATVGATFHRPSTGLNFGEDSQEDEMLGAAVEI